MPMVQNKGPRNTVFSPRYNERRVLQAIRRFGEISKADLARQVNLTNTAVGTIVSSLHKENLLEISGKRHKGQRGQPATLYRLAPDGAFSVGVRVDRSWIQTCLINFDGKVLSRLSHERILPKPAIALEIILQDIAIMLETLADEQRARMSGIGLAHPYNLNSWLNELSLPNEEFLDWDGYDLAEQIEKATAIPVCSENDVTAASIAELFYGVGRKIDDFIYVFIGPGIGGGVVIDGKSVSGPLGNAGDIGLMLVPPSTLDSAPKPEKNWDILLNRASVNTLIRHLNSCGHNVHSTADVMHLVDNEAEGVSAWLHDCAQALTPALWGAAALLDSPVVVLGSDLGGTFIPKLIAELEQQLNLNVPEARIPPRLMPGSFGSDAESIGAAILPFFNNFHTQDSSN